MKKKFVHLLMLIAITLFNFMPFVNVYALNANIIYVHGATGGTYRVVTPENAPDVDFSTTTNWSTNGGEVTLTATPSEGYGFAGWFVAVEENNQWVADSEQNLSGFATYTFNATDSLYHIIPVFELQPTCNQPLQHNNIWTTSGGKEAVVYAPLGKDGTNYSTGEEVNYCPGDEITVKAKANANYNFAGWYVSNVQQGPEYYYSNKLVSTDLNYTYQPGITTVPGIDEPINYLTAVFLTESEITRATITNYHTIVEGTLTITGDATYNKSYVSGDKTNENEYIDGNIADNDVANLINTYKDDMQTIADNYKAIVTTTGAITSYYFNVHDEITQDNLTGAITITTVLDKYQVYTLTGTAEVNKVTYTLDDERGNQIIFQDYEGIVYVFNSTDILNMTEEELQQIANDMQMDIEDVRALGTQVLEMANNAVKGKGTLVGVYDFSVFDGNNFKEQSTNGFKIRIKMSAEMKKFNDFKIAFLKNDGTLEEPITLTQNGEFLEGTLPHLSTYVIIGNNVDKAIATPNTADKLPLYISILVISILGLAGIGIYNRKKYNK